MKNLTFIFAIIIGLFTMQSCSIDSEIVYHKDKTTSLTLGMDFEEMMNIMSKMDSTESRPPKKMGKLDLLPENWTSLYEMELKEGKKTPTDEDSIRFMKKTFIKKSVKDDKTTGFAFKLDHFTKDELQFFTNEISKDKEGALIQQGSNIGEWDGKKLILNTDKLNFDEFKKAGFPSEKQKSEGEEKMMEIMKMIKMDITQNLKFENKIKRIKGKHDWVKQIDDYTIQIKFSSEMMYDEKSLKNKDKEIIIITK